MPDKYTWESLNNWTSEMQRIGVVNHDFVARFDPRFIEQLQEKPIDGLENYWKGTKHGSQTR